MSDENPRLKKWLEQKEQSKYQPDRQNRSLQQVNKSVVYHVFQNDTAGTYYVGFWRRFFAKFIDWAVINTVAFTVYAILYFRIVEDSKSLSLAPLPFIIPLLIWFLYYTVLPSTKLQGTIGKLAVGAKIVNKYGRQLSYSNSVGRFFASILSWALFIGFIMVASNTEKRGLHDMMASTYVINKKQRTNGMLH